MKITYELPPRFKKSHLECCRKFQLVRIKSDSHQQAAYEVIEELLMTQIDKGQEEYLLTLSGLVADYEDQNIDFGGKTTPSEMLAHLMESKGITASVLSKATGIGKPTISDILSERVKVSKNNAIKIGDYLGVDPVFFLRQLASA